MKNDDPIYRLLCDAKNTECFRVWCLQRVAEIAKEFDESLADKKKRKVMRKFEPYDAALNLLFAFQAECEARDRRESV